MRLSTVPKTGSDQILWPHHVPCVPTTLAGLVRGPSNSSPGGSPLQAGINGAHPRALPSRPLPSGFRGSLPQGRLALQAVK